MKRKMVLGSPRYQEALSRWKETKTKKYNMEKQLLAQTVLDWHFDTALLFLNEHGFWPYLCRRDMKVFGLNEDFDPIRVQLEVDYGFVTKITIG